MKILTCRILHRLVIAPFAALKRVYDWLPILWKDRDYDYEYVVILLIFKLKRLEKFMDEEYHSHKGLESIRATINALDMSLSIPYYEKRWRNFHKKWDHIQIDDIWQELPEDMEKEQYLLRTADEAAKNTFRRYALLKMSKHVQDWWG
jgi:hypothetical protein